MKSRMSSIVQQHTWKSHHDQGLQNGKNMNQIDSLQTKMTDQRSKREKLQQKKARIPDPFMSRTREGPSGNTDIHAAENSKHSRSSHLESKKGRQAREAYLLQTESLILDESRETMRAKGAYLLPTTQVCPLSFFVLVKGWAIPVAEKIHLSHWLAKQASL